MRKQIDTRGYFDEDCALRMKLSQSQKKKISKIKISAAPGAKENNNNKINKNGFTEEPL